MRAVKASVFPPRHVAGRSLGASLDEGAVSLTTSFLNRLPVPQLAVKVKV